MGLRRTWAAVAACTLALGLAACGSSSNTSTSAGTHTSATGVPALKPNQRAAITPPSQLRAAQNCLTTHGYAEPGTKGTKPPTTAQMVAAEKACRAYLPKAPANSTPALHPPSAATQAEDISALHAAVGCLRGHGIKLISAVPKTAPKLTVVFGEAVALHAALSSPADSVAVKACSPQINTFNTLTQAPQTAR